MEVPQENGVDIRALRQVDLCPLLAGPKLDPGAFVAVLVSIVDHIQCSNDWIVIARGDFLVLCEVNGADGNQEIGALGFCGALKIGHIERTGVPTKRGGGSLVFKGTLSCATAAIATSSAIRTARFFTGIFIIVSGFHFFRSDGEPRLRGYGIVRF